MNSIKEKVYKLIRWSEKYTKTDMVYLTSGGFWMTVGHFIAILSGLGLSIVMANFVPQTDFGNYKFVLSIFGIIGAFALTGIGTSISRSVAKGFDSAFKKGFKVHLKWSVILLLMSFVVSIYYFLNDNNSLGLSFLIVGSLSPFMTSFSLYGNFLLGKKDFRRKAFYNSFQNLLPAIAVAITALVTNNPVIFILVFFVFNTATVAILFFKTSKLISKDNGENESTSFGKHLSLMNILGTLVSHLDKVLIFHFLGAAAVAVYTFAIMPPKNIQSFSQILKQLMLPKLAEKNIEEIKKVVIEKMIKLFGISLLIFLAYYFLAPLIYMYIFPQYIEAIEFSRIFAVVILFTPNILLSQTLVAHAKKKALYISKIVPPIIDIILLLILLPIYGIWGALISTLVFEITRMASLFLIFKFSLDKKDE